MLLMVLPQKIISEVGYHVGVLNLKIHFHVQQINLYQSLKQNKIDVACKKSKTQFYIIIKAHKRVES